MTDMRFDHTIPKELLSSARVRGRLLAACQKVVKRTKEYAKGTSDNFESFDVNWSDSIRFSGGDIQISVWTDSEIYAYLNDGTDERWAVMNEPFVSKTQPDAIQSGPGYRTYTGGYYTKIRGRQAMQERNMQARPGIEGRDFSGQIEEIMEDEFFTAIEDAIDEAL